MKKVNFNIQNILSLIEFRWSAVGLYSIASIFSVSLRLDGFQANSRFFKDLMLLGLVVTFITLLLLLVGFRVLEILKSSGKFTNYGIVILLPLVGAIRGVVLYQVIDVYGYTNRISLASSIISSLLYTSIYYGGASLFVSLILKTNRLFHSEFQKAAYFRLNRDRESKSPSESATYEETMTKMNMAVSSKVTDSSLHSREEIVKVAEEIRFQIENVLRPLSHRLWVDSFGEIRTGKPWNILKGALIEMHFSRKFIIGYQFIIGIFGIGIAIGLKSGIVKSIFATLTSLGLIFFFEKVWVAKHGPSFAGSLIFLASMTVFPVVASEVASSFLSLSVDWLAGALIAPALPAIVVISAVYGLVASDKELALSAAKSIRFVEENDFGIDSKSTESRELSEYLHNTLQSELLRLSKQLEIAEDPERISMYYKQLDVALSRTREDIHDLKSQGLDRLLSVCQSWEGIARVVLEFEDLSDIEIQKISYVCHILEEIISNSIRYGNADQILINLHGRAPHIDVSVSHNGKRDISDGIGLGSLTIFSRAIAGPVIEKSIDFVTVKFAL